MAKKGRKPNPDKNYFVERQEQALIDYLKSDSVVERNKIFNTILYPALTTMIESIIRRYKLQVPDEEFEQTFNDTISYLLSKIANFNPDKGCKAYSYCGTVAKNYLIAKNVQLAKNKQRYDSYDTLYDSLKNDEKYVITVNEHNMLPEILIKSSLTSIKEMLDDKELYKLSDKEIKVGNALCHLFENWSTIMPNDGSNKLHKSTVLYFLRETTMMSTKEIRDNMKKFKNVYKSLKEKNL